MGRLEDASACMCAPMCVKLSCALSGESEAACTAWRMDCMEAWISTGAIDESRRSVNGDMGDDMATKETSFLRLRLPSRLR